MKALLPLLCLLTACTRVVFVPTSIISTNVIRTNEYVFSNMSYVTFTSLGWTNEISANICTRAKHGALEISAFPFTNWLTINEDVLRRMLTNDYGMYSVDKTRSVVLLPPNMNWSWNEKP